MVIHDMIFKKCPHVAKELGQQWVLGNYKDHACSASMGREKVYPQLGQALKHESPVGQLLSASKLSQDALERWQVREKNCKHRL
ncbi:hypothetical protein NUU61_006608 [Penicillium alfredii]|uniref:Uncharacterized protein n=1 Tax=Penicillium alfredii TaxID=1506179 RepID=A0A9W9K3H3_9EURO|nr:uncharacterized protein NUU61_006608 [Penicillium alfredii]KAJ5091738.1 hypothetical protein NUU61_006608 [Penicillium alfredii]